MLFISKPKRSLFFSLLRFRHSRARPITDASSDSDGEASLILPSSSSSPESTISYLVDSWHLSPAAAASIARKIRVKDPFKPDLVLKFLKDHSFTPSQITSLVTRRPEILGSNPRTRFKPKVEFFRGMGLSGTDFAKVVTANPLILCNRLEGKLEVSAAYLKEVVGSDANVVTALRRDPWLLHFNVEKILRPNLETLRNHGIPDARIALLVVRQPRTLLQRPETFSTLVSDLLKLGYDPSRQMFIYALSTISSMSSAMWNAKIEAYRSCGWTDDEILRAFRRHPDFVLKSVERIKQVMGFLMGKLCLNPEEIIKYPTLITCSLEKRIIPRCCVLNVLISRGILTKDCNLVAKLHKTKARFESLFVTRYRDKVPEVLEAYEGKMEFKGFGLIDDKCVSSICK